MMDVGNITGANMQLTTAVRVGGNVVNPALEAAVKRWDAEFRKREAAATQRSTTTRSTTTQSTTADVAGTLKRMLKTQDTTSEVYTQPATQPAVR